MTKTAMGVVALALAAAAGTAMAQDISTVNGYRVEARVFNDYPNSNVTINGVPYPVPGNGAIAGQVGPVVMNEVFNQADPQAFANKHLAYLSNDGGLSRFTLNPGQSWTMDFNVRMAAPGPGPRKEAGIQFVNPRLANNPPFDDEGQLLIASDGEVAVFGAAMPFTGFGNVYTLNTMAHVMFQFFAPGTVNPTLGAYRVVFTDAITGPHDSGLKIWGVEADGTAGFNTGTTMALKAQNQRNPFGDGLGGPDSSLVQYNDITIVPAPAGLALLGPAGLAASRRRR